LLAWPQVVDFKLPMLGAMAFPITRLYDRGTTLQPAELLRKRTGEAYVVLNVQDAERLKVAQGGMVRINLSVSGQSVVVQVRLDAALPERVVLTPRSFGLPIHGPTAVELKPERG
jgi:anaerobic selenocysteine-containing dehydrogenase